ncbi:MAG TPA: urease subunit gamma [Candidatus Limnocylindria bacterium]|nr:urease subunit gamma [Candidatus Limnocylindria bacterium]
MRLTPWEEERLLIFSAAELARRHRAAGILLNTPEAIALMCDAMLEAARAGTPSTVASRWPAARSRPCRSQRFRSAVGTFFGSPVRMPRARCA